MKTLLSDALEIVLFGLKRLVPVIAALGAGILLAQPASAITTLYTNDESGFLSAAGSLAFESFEGITPNGTPVPSLSFAGFTMPYLNLPPLRSSGSDWPQ